jgi:molybdopterin adenylyltransferase
MGTIVAVCTSETRGVQKTPTDAIELVVGHGVKGDAHAGDWHRQVSLLADESAELMRRKGAPAGPGAFGENIVTRDIDVKALPVGARIRIKGQAPTAPEVLLEVTQIGKVCHEPCAIFAIAGECIMPTEGVFCRVLAGGLVRPGDAIEVIVGVVEGMGQPARTQESAPASASAEAPAPALSFRVAVLVLSDSRSAGQREDLVVPAVAEKLGQTAFDLVHTRIIADDEAGIVEVLRELVARGDIHLILTSGGTGLAPRDHAPEATRSVIEREAPGFAELLRMKGLEKTPRAMLTRGVAGVARQTLIINLPGSPKAVREGLETLLPILPHALETLLGQSSECART